MAGTQFNSTEPPTYLRLVLEGGQARLGEVPALDVAKLIEGAIRSIARSAELIAGRQPGQVGRRGAATENATRFVLRRIESGSVAIALDRPLATVDDGGLELDDPRLTELAVDRTLDALSGLELDAYIASGLATLADDLAIGSRYTSLRFEALGGGSGSRTAVLNRASSSRLRQIAAQTAQALSTAVVGTLVEADFERHTARLRTPDNQTVRVNFTEDHADEIQRALRHNAEFDGVVTFDNTTRQAIAVEMRSIRRTHQLGLNLDDSDYWRITSVATLAAEQGVAPVADMAEIHDSTATEDEINAFFEALEL